MHKFLKFITNLWQYTIYIYIVYSNGNNIFSSDYNDKGFSSGDDNNNNNNRTYIWNNYDLMHVAWFGWL